MDKPKESKVRTRVMEILRNHDQEARVIEAQIAAEKEALEADLEFILESAYPGHTFLDRMISSVIRRRRPRPVFT